MMIIKDFLNKLKWDKLLNAKDYQVYYSDRRINKTVEIPFTAIKKIEKNFMVIEKDLHDVDIPLHRIKEVRKRGKLVWARNVAP